MPVVADNIDQFVIHPTYALAGLLPDQEHADRVLEALSTALDADVEVQLLHGEEGLRILDQGGSGHGRTAWFHRLLQNWTYYEQILGIYSEGLRRGELLTVIPCALDVRRQVAATMVPHGAHRLYYFGYDTVESMVTG
ncbi:hypothetical protein GCM10010172_04230 [Paractinoplanes ferrugineus]|uniref:Uncharacterized protein n=1 Tax=Paractinoplanes ferrugineus TaxID=113564 RepID=A0A919J6D0_9ACTN|nr:hypothetical protein [Actinoplanes ferrugineus]GIE13828.1 hypothetical protein Afe05nite_56680 [Actinoplanes ferrugineus]